MSKQSLIFFFSQAPLVFLVLHSHRNEQPAASSSSSIQPQHRFLSAFHDRLCSFIVKTPFGFSSLLQTTTSLLITKCKSSQSASPLSASLSVSSHFEPTKNHHQQTRCRLLISLLLFPPPPPGRILLRAITREIHQQLVVGVLPAGIGELCSDPFHLPSLCKMWRLVHVCIRRVMSVSNNLLLYFFLAWILVAMRMTFSSVFCLGINRMICLEI